MYDFGKGAYFGKKEKRNIRSSAAEYFTYVVSVGEQEDSIEIRYKDENI